MKSTIALLIAVAVLTGCAGQAPDKAVKTPARGADPAAPARAATPASSASTLAAYKRDAALHISSANPAKVYPGRPQALLRSVIVMKYAVDARGRLVRSEILRSNRDGETESAALHSLRSAAPLPRPSSHLLRNGQLELIETWLFNDDGRFQLRTIAQPQLDS
ncbi:MAG TPA: hypothetical protein VEC06_06310 [Paucimonas sp.]|nr:hypothetical protein [Paucimonas sp.]